jgi:hypothetical protein
MAMSLRLIGAAAALIMALFVYQHRVRPVSAPDFPRPLASALGGQIHDFEVDELYDRGVTTASLAEPGVYTVVAFTGRGCGLAQALEQRMPDFLAARQDVVFKNVHLGGGGVKFFHSRKDMQAWRDRQDGIRTRYHLDFAPKVFVFGPDRQPVVGERHRGDQGYRFMMAWVREPANGR